MLVGVGASWRHANCRPLHPLRQSRPCTLAAAGSIPLRPELAALRQRLYKLDNKVKHEFKRDAGTGAVQCVHGVVLVVQWLWMVVINIQHRGNPGGQMGACIVQQCGLEAEACG